MNENARILDGKKLAVRIRNELQQKLISHQKHHHHSSKPGLAALLIGDDPASHVYIQQKEKALKEAGFLSEVHRLPADISQEKVLALIDTLNQASHIDGILIQLPLPSHLSSPTILQAVFPEKDVDGFHTDNLGRLFSGNPRFIPCTPKGILRLLQSEDIPITGKKVVIVGRSLIVGRPVALLFLQKDATVTICHSKTVSLEKECQNADILIVAIGKPSFITEAFIKKGAIVVDVGIHRGTTGLIGDVNFAEVSRKASYITPVPGGVGPMTIAMLLENTWEAFLHHDPSSTKIR